MICESLEHNLPHDHKETQYEQADMANGGFQSLVCKQKENCNILSIMEWIMHAREYTVAVGHDKVEFYGMNKPKNILLSEKKHIAK